MPKNSFARRQRRQTNLLLLSHPGQTGDSSPRSTPRQVSDEDIQMNSALTSASSSSSCLDSLGHSKNSLKRASPTPCVVEVMVPECLESLDDCESTASSPWGYFVDLLKNDDRKSQPSDQTLDACKQHTRTFTMPLNRLGTGPYPIQQLKRQRVRPTSPTCPPRFVLETKILPRSSSSETELLQDALKSLAV
jgi:hypothetical protein